MKTMQGAFTAMAINETGAARSIYLAPNLEHQSSPDDGYGYTNVELDSVFQPGDGRILLLHSINVSGSDAAASEMSMRIHGTSTVLMIFSGGSASDVGCHYDFGPKGMRIEESVFFLTSAHIGFWAFNYEIV